MTFFYGALGVILGGRLGYCLFYRPDYYLSHPLDIVKTWDGGMSFHGGMLGVLLQCICLPARLIVTFCDFRLYCTIYTCLSNVWSLREFY